MSIECVVKIFMGDPPRAQRVSFVALSRAIYRVTSTGSGKGKTLVGTAIVSGLAKMGYRVAAVKHAHEKIDVEGKDSYNYMKAGAGQVVLSSPTVTALFVRGAIEGLDALLPLLDSRYFIVVVEGFKKSEMGKQVIVASNPSELDELHATSENTLAIVSDGREVIEEAVRRGIKAYKFAETEELTDLVAEDALETALSTLPRTDCGRCGVPTCKMFAYSVLRGERTIADCPVTADLKLVVDSVQIKLNPYVKHVFNQTIQALVGTLKGVREYPESIEISIRRRREKNSS